MVTLLAFEHVGKRYQHGTGEHVALRDVSLELEAGELVAIWGRRGSGRSTLLRLAAGIEPPDTGVVRFAGRDLAATAGAELGSTIGFCRRAFGGAEGRVVLDALTVSQLARGAPLPVARTGARAALERVGAERCAMLGPQALDSAETVRVAIARALLSRPSLLVIDEPARGVDLLDRDGVLALLRSLADEGLAVLMSAGESTELAGADRALSLDDGALHGGRGNAMR
jgi:ABC-type multidrug transport system ATPase subunit